MQPHPERLDRAWLARPAEEIARELLGCRLVRTLDDSTLLSGFIIETEAYTGPEDRASHAFGGRRTERNESMWAEPGTAYVYFTYGMHFCMNISCLREGHPAAVLIRAIAPERGIETMRALRTTEPRKHPLKDQDLSNGPAKLCQALAIDRSLDGLDLLQSPHLTVCEGVSVPEKHIRRTPRIGIANAGDWLDKPLRWVTGMHPDGAACGKVQ